MNPTARPASSPSLYRFLSQVMPILLGWAAASLTLGIFLKRSGDVRLRGVGDQFIGWGAVDGTIAAAGLAGAAKNAARLENGEIDNATHARDAKHFEKIVWANAALDIGYVLGGILTLQRNPGDPYRQGTGLGITLQGGFLFAWDVILGFLIRKFRHDYFR